MSIQDIQQNPQETSNFYLAGIYQSILDPNRSDILSSLPASPPPFSPPTYAIWVNSLWFLSLVVSITCALLATLMQQWARRYLKVTQTRSSLHKRARIRSFFAEGVKKSHFAWVVEALPTLIHVSLFLFFAGLVVFSWNVNLTIFKVVLSWISICTALYGYITIIPIFRHDSPCYSPLTPLAKPVVFMVLLVLMLLYYFCVYLFLQCFFMCFGCCGSIHAMFGHLLAWFIEVLKTTRLTPEKAALNSSSEIDTRALMWTFDSLDEDHELEHFFSGLPGFHNSKILKEPLHGINDQQKLKLLEAVIRLLDRTFSSNLLPDQVKRRRADICNNAMKLVDTPNAFPDVVRCLASEDEYGPVQSTQIVDFVRCWGSRKLDHNRQYSAVAQAIFSIVVARVQQHDDSWFILASDQLGITETVLRSHAAHGDNLSFAILIYVTRKQFNHFGDSSWPSYRIRVVLGAASKFNVEDTSPELQHEFCALWNQVVRKAHNDNDGKISRRILKPIRNVYIRLHQGTNSAPTKFSASTSEEHEILHDPYTYPVCNVTGHGHDGSSSATSLPPVSHDDPSLSPASLASPAAPSLPSPAPFCVDECLTTLPPHNTSYPTRQTTQSFRVPVTSPDPASAGAMRDPVFKKQKGVIVTPAPQSAPEASAISYPPSVPQSLSAPVPPSTSALDNTLKTSPSLYFLLSRLHLTFRTVLSLDNSYHLSPSVSESRVHKHSNHGRSTGTATIGH